MKHVLIVLMFLTLTVESLFAQTTSISGLKNEDRIQPWSLDSRYWQYKSKPVLLLGGSKTDHIFLAEGLLEHLEEIYEVGGNYVRNTMSQREEKELKAHLLLADGKFDMDKWNPEYWARFENMLKWTSERNIFVQIEVWDRFDYAEQNWLSSPWNPRNNINYDYGESGFDKEYTNNHLYRDAHPFFHTIEGTSHYVPHYDLIRQHQEKFVDKMLSYSLPYGHVLYCMNNETSSEAGWGQYWISFIRSKADEKGITVITTDMFNDAHKGNEAVNTPIMFKDSYHYNFADISQVNSRNFDDDHWKNLLWLIQKVNKEKPRPCNHIKIYGGGYLSFGTGGLEDGVERFWRNIIAGSASSRFHRPTAGNGLNERAVACIKAVRLLEKDIKLWEIEPHMELLTSRLPNEAFLAAKPNEKYAIYFTNGGSVGLDLSEAKGTYKLKWISITEGIILEPGSKIKDSSLQGGSVVNITTPYKGGWVAVILKE